MKILKKILCGLALGTMAVGVGIGIKGNNAKVVKATDEITYSDAYISKFELEICPDVNRANFWLYIKGESIDIADGAANTPIKADRLAEFNLLDKISFTKNGQETLLKDLLKQSGTADYQAPHFNLWTRGCSIYFCLDKDLASALATTDVSKEQFAGLYFTGYEGCTFPTFAYGTEDSPASKTGYKLAARAMADYKRDSGVTAQYKIEGTIDVLSAWELVSPSVEIRNPEKTSIVLGFPGEEFGEGKISTTANIYTHPINAALLYGQNVKINGSTIYDGSAVKDDSIIKSNLNYWDRKGAVCFDLGTKYDTVSSIDVKAGTVIPTVAKNYCGKDQAWDVFKNNIGTARVVLNDVHFEANGVSTELEGRYVRPLIKVGKAINIDHVDLVKWTDVGYMVEFFSDYVADVTNFGTHTKVYNSFNFELYHDDQKIEYTLGEEIKGLNGASYTRRVKNGADTFGDLPSVNKIIIKAGMQFPGKYGDSAVEGLFESRAELKADYIAQDIVLVKNGKHFTVDNDANHRVYSETEDLVLNQFALRVSGNDKAIQFWVGNDSCNYNAWENNKEANLLNDFANIDFFSKLHLIKHDGSELVLNKDMVDRISYHNWTDPCFFMFLNDLVPTRSLFDVTKVDVDAGFELPNATGNIKYVAAEPSRFALIDGNQYDVTVNEATVKALGQWLCDPDTKIFNKFKMSKVGTAQISVCGDTAVDAGGHKMVWLDVRNDQGEKLYPNVAPNKGDVYDALFHLNTLSKIVLIKDGVETRLSDFNFLFEQFVVNKWGREDKNVAIAPLEAYNFDYTNYDAIRIEAGCQVPTEAQVNKADTNKIESGNTVEYLETTEAVTYYLTNTNMFGLPATVTFNGGDPVDVLTNGTIPNFPAAQGQEATAEFTYEGFWKDANGNEVTADTIVTGNLVLTSDIRSTRVSYNVSYLDENDQAISGLGGSVANASNVTLAEVPAKTGYTGHWESTDVTLDGTTFVMPAKNVTLKAVYEANSYELSFEGVTDPMTVTYGQAVGTLPAVPAREGYHNGKWMLNGEELTAETIYNFAEDKEVVASYTKNVYEVTFDSNGGSSVAASTVEHGGKVTKPADPTREGYTFKGWFVGETAYDFNSEVTGAVALTAKWEIKSFTVSFNSNGGTAVAATTVDYGAKVTKPADPTKEGFTFKGWFVGETAYDFNSEVTANVTLTAKWEAIPADEPEAPAAKTGCGGSILAGSAIITLVSALGACLLASKKKED